MNSATVRASATSALIGVAYAYLTSLPVLLGAYFGMRFLDAHRHGRSPAQSLAEAAGDGVGHRYAEIVSHGYLEDTFAFFPLFPLLGHAVRAATGLAAGEALLIVAYCAMGAAFVALRAYTRARFPNDSERDRDYVLLAFGLWPTGFFFRMAYPEPLFVLLAVIALLAIERKRLWMSAIVGGLASAARPVGVAVALPIAMRAWSSGGSLPVRAIRTGVAGMLACSGLIAYMAYQSHVYGNSLQFVHAQSFWRVRPAVPIVKQAMALASFEPVTGLYQPSSAMYWAYREDHRVVLFSFLAANGPLFLLVAFGIVAGAYRRWLTRGEIALSAALLVIPYLTRGYEMGMSGQGRFAAAAFPFYLVGGKALSSLPRPAAAALLAILATFLMFYSSFAVTGFALK